MLTKFVQTIAKKFESDKKSKKYNLSNFPIVMTEGEREFLLENIKNAENYLEFGAGGSTFLSLLQTDIQNIVSVESDMNWLEYLRNWEIISSNENKRLYFEFVNIGETKQWGFPVNDEKKSLFPNYSQKPFLSDTNWNAVFIDGRFRAACLLQTVLNCDKNTKILMHDFNNRKHYHNILKFVDIVDTQDSMALFKTKDSLDRKEAEIMYEQYQFISD